ncbi:TPM domain-containing protein [Cardiobacterium valvarum]|uniref:TPM domain-containing protein n=1 Tax=Cardiobacterium valvarum F0432 TaxID=797473 RepID=G9ZBL4_9GAMM|nr:TPM domain-containing protein [Cardiobacterium valvarum]EHM56057.1 hypothetical protein HMPREF9080_00137 [Cardiobacterium valvarum F0432]
MIRILFSLILALCIPAYAVSPDALKLDHPVIDQAEILSDAQEAALANRLRGWYDDGLMQAAVVTVDSTDGIPLQDYTQTLFARWQLGDATKNDGLLILIAHRNHRLRIQPGRGLDDILSTNRLQDIINTRITPAFKRGDYAGGIDSGLDAIVSRLTAPPPAPVTQRDYNFFLLTLVCTCVLGWHLGETPSLPHLHPAALRCRLGAVRHLLWRQQRPCFWQCHLAHPRQHHPCLAPHRPWQSTDEHCE